MQRMGLWWRMGGGWRSAERGGGGGKGIGIPRGACDVHILAARRGKGEEASGTLWRRDMGRMSGDLRAIGTNDVDQKKGDAIRGSISVRGLELSQEAPTRIVGCAIEHLKKVAQFQ